MLRLGRKLQALLPSLGAVSVPEPLQPKTPRANALNGFLGRQSSFTGRAGSIECSNIEGSERSVVCRAEKLAQD
jgi:hypothetical protein